MMQAVVAIFTLTPAAYELLSKMHSKKVTVKDALDPWTKYFIEFFTNIPYSRVHEQPTSIKAMNLSDTLLLKKLRQ
jgi:hypothetical protein